MAIYYYDTKYGRFTYNTEEKELQKAITTDSENILVKKMLASSFNKGSFIANDRNLYDVEKEPELFFREGIPHILKAKS